MNQEPRTKKEYQQVLRKIEERRKDKKSYMQRLRETCEREREALKRLADR